ncbi:MAG: efflux RND transporter periplasmic adaptor subunit [Flavobacteriales bacterium]|nr:efflux RND transporter periplasmic adaptor subunit [Flavobacteriales bacterium]
MKQIVAILIGSMVIISCGGEQKESLEQILQSKDLVKIREKRAEIVAEQLEINQKIKQLDAVIAAIDTVKNLPNVSTLIVKEESFNHYLDLQGNVETKQNILVYPEFSGVLKQVVVKEGQAVSKGQVLARIDDGGLSQQLAQLEIQAQLSKTTFERQERLWKQKIGSEIQYLQAKTQYEAQAKAVDQMQKNLDKTVVRAPFTGVVDDVITDEGSVVAPGQTPLFRVVNLNDMYVTVDVPERYITNVTIGKDVKANFPVLGKTIDSKVRQTGKFINPANRTFKIEVPLENKDQSIKPNLTAKLRINDYSNEKALLIPLSVISEDASGEQYVYVVQNKDKDQGVSKKATITTGQSEGDLVEVLSGLSVGSEIIIEGARSVKDAQEVRILNKQ